MLLGIGQAVRENVGKVVLGVPVSVKAKHQHQRWVGALELAGAGLENVVKILGSIE